jgi:hypothetical protein
VASDAVKEITQNDASKVTENDSSGSERLKTQETNRQKAAGASTPVSSDRAQMPPAKEASSQSDNESTATRNVPTEMAAKRMATQPSTPGRSKVTSVGTDDIRDRARGDVPTTPERKMPPKVDPRTTTGPVSPTTQARAVPPAIKRDPRTISTKHPVGSMQTVRQMARPVAESNTEVMGVADLQNPWATVAPGQAANTATKKVWPVGGQANFANGVGRIENTKAMNSTNQPPTSGTLPKPAVPSESTPPAVLERSMFTKEKPVCMPNMGKFQGSYLLIIKRCFDTNCSSLNSCCCFGFTAKVIRWYKTKGQRVEHNDLLCDIETEVSSQ